MEISDKYTTLNKIAADTEGIESKKIIISEDTFALCEFMHELSENMKNFGVKLK